MGLATATAEATGGRGGRAFGGTGGEVAGDAEATATGSAAAGAAAIATARGGEGGFGGGVGRVRGGNAVARSSAAASGAGVATSSANASGGRGLTGGSALATAEAAAASGEAAASADSATIGFVRAVRASGAAGVDGMANAQAYTAVTGPTRTLADAAGFGAVAYATADPLDADVLALIADDRNVRLDFNPDGAGPGPVSDVFGQVTLGGSGEGTGGVVTASAAFTLDLAADRTDQTFLVGYADTASTGDGFDELSYSIDYEGTTLVAETFFSLAEANAFFNDRVQDLGTFSGITGDLDLTFTVSMRGLGVADSYATSFVFGNATVGSGVPEPATAALLAAGGLLLGRRRRVG